MGRLIRGAMAGIGATIIMSVAMAAAKALGLIEETPPKEITSRAEKAVGMGPDARSGPDFAVRWVLAHFGYGTFCGAVYAVLRRLIPGGAVVSGIVFGLLVWGVSYLGFLPALKLYPWPDEDRESRSAAMIALHVVYGASLGKLANRK